MPFSSGRLPSVALVLLFLQCVSAAPMEASTNDAVSRSVDSEIAHPTQNATMVRRAGNGSGDSRRNAKEVTIDIDGHDSTWEADCWAILCGDKSRVLQRDSAHISDRRKQSGANARPFADPLRNGVSRPDDQHTSAEEYPFASTVEGGSGAILAPATIGDQRSQGSKLKQIYKGENGYTAVEEGEYYRLNFAGYKRGGYCEQLMKNPDDKRICNEGMGKEGRAVFGFDFGRFAFSNSSPQEATPTFSFVGKFATGISRRFMRFFARRDQADA